MKRRALPVRPLALLNRAVLSILMSATVAVVERRLRAALKQRSPN
jgi:hypothetical protein